MTKRLQNRIAESRYTLPVTVLYSITIWFFAGLVSQQWWIQFACFAVSASMMMLLNRENILIRIYSRMVSSVYLALSCAAVFFFASLSSAVMQMGAATSLFLLWHSYQDKKAVGWAYYTFLCLGIGSIMQHQVLFYLPIFWIIMKWFTYSLSWRTFCATLMGLLTPYWFCLPYFAIQGEKSIELLSSHLNGFANLTAPPDYSLLNITQLVYLGFLVVLMVIGSLHFIINSFRETIRVRQIYYSFILMAAFSLFLIIVRPQCYDMAILVLILTSSPMIAHFFTLTKSRFTNYLFIITLTLIFLFTAYQLWISSLPF